MWMMLMESEDDYNYMLSAITQIERWLINDMLIRWLGDEYSQRIQ